MRTDCFSKTHFYVKTLVWKKERKKRANNQFEYAFIVRTAQDSVFGMGHILDTKCVVQELGKWSKNGGEQRLIWHGFTKATLVKWYIRCIPYNHTIAMYYIYQFQQNKMLRAAYTISQLQRLQARFYLHYVQWPAINTAVLSYRHKHSQPLGNTAVFQIIMGEGNGCLKHAISMCKISKIRTTPLVKLWLFKTGPLFKSCKINCYSWAKPSRQRAWAHLFSPLIHT